MNAQVDTWRVGRNFIRTGDTVKVLPSRPKKKDGGPATVLRMYLDDAGEKVATVLVRHEGKERFYRADRIARVAQTRNGERRALVR